MAEEQSKPQGLTEEIAAAIMTANMDDLSRLGAICSTLEEIADRLQETHPLCAALAASLNAGLENIILDDYGDLDDPLDIVAQGIALLQRAQSEFERTGQEVFDDPNALQEVNRLSGVEVEVAGEAGSGGENADDQEALTPEAMIAAGLETGVGQTADDDLEDGDAEADDEALTPASFSMAAIDPDLFTDFFSEAMGHLDTAENTLLTLENSPEDSELLNLVFRAFHTIKGAAGFLNLDDIIHVSHVVEDVLDSARKNQLVITSSILDVVLESVDLLKALLEDAALQLKGGEAPPRETAAFVAKVEAVSSGKAPAAESPATASQTAATPPAVPAAPQEASQPAAGRNGQQGSADQHFVRVGTEKLDHLVDLVGELVITQTQVSQSTDVVFSTNQKLGKDVSQLSKTTKDIQEIAMSLRMVPIRGTFERMARIVRDLTRKCGKEVEFQMVGEDTELDKNVVEELVDPLTHMVRNAVDHGVETPEERQTVGKSAKGVVRLEAYHQGGNIVIEMKDDGQGLNREKILQKAIERGLVRENGELSDREVYDLIMRPGFSTAETVSDISGRGVGMDVVRRNIEQLQGKVEVDSQTGQGSTFTIRLPLTLAIIDGMIIGVGQERYILPLTSIVRSFRPSQDDVSTVMNRGEMVQVQGELFPLVRLHQRFEVSPLFHNPCDGLVVLIDAEGEQYCLLVDELVGMQQVVIKALEEKVRGERCLAGCAILGDGQVGLILDPQGLAFESNGKSQLETAALSATA